MAKFMGFYVYERQDYGYVSNWLDEIYTDTTYSTFYIIKAKNKEEASKKMFLEHIYKELSKDNTFMNESIYFEFIRLAESFDKEQLIERFGEKDGQLIYEIIEEYYDEYEAKGYLDIDGKYKKLSAETIKEIAYDA